MGCDFKYCNVLRTVALYLLTQGEMRVGVKGGGGGVGVVVVVVGGRGGGGGRACGYFTIHHKNVTYKEYS